ncbi:MAG: hypothetical protein ACE5I1_23510 [bacterium]
MVKQYDVLKDKMLFQEAGKQLQGKQNDKRLTIESRLFASLLPHPSEM